MSNVDRVKSLLKKKPRKKTIYDIRIKANAEVTFADKVADKLANYYGSWTCFIFLALIIAVWMVVGEHIDDPYPFVFLNLMLAFVSGFTGIILLLVGKRNEHYQRMVFDHNYEMSMSILQESIILHKEVNLLRQAMHEYLCPDELENKK